MRVPSSVFVLIAVLAAPVLFGCKTAAPGGFQCLNDGDCPPGCSCNNDFATVGVCEHDTSGKDCGGTCDRETSCPEGTECELQTTGDRVYTYACLGETLGDLGAACEANSQCDPNASSLGAYCCLDFDNCGPNLNQCVEDCSTYSSGMVQDFEGAECKDSSECGASLFCCLVPDSSGNCDFAQDQSCTCRSDSGSGECLGELVVQTIMSDLPCTPPDASACGGCNEYCIGNGFPFGSMDETCQSGFCECDCAYCIVN